MVGKLVLSSLLAFYVLGLRREHLKPLFHVVQVRVHFPYQTLYLWRNSLLIKQRCLFSDFKIIKWLCEKRTEEIFSFLRSVKRAIFSDVLCMSLPIDVAMIEN